MQLDSSPGVDGLPIEFYECLLKAADSPLTEWLQTVYIHSFNLGTLHPQMCQSQIRLLFKKEAEQDRLYPQNYRPIALLKKKTNQGTEKKTHAWNRPLNKQKNKRGNNQNNKHGNDQRILNQRNK